MVIERFRSLVLCYHAISESWDHALAVHPLVFERHLESLLRRGYRPASAEECLDGRRRLLHVTFDDAYRSVQLALPALERLGVPATVFACTGSAFVGRALAIPELAAAAAERPDELTTMSWDEVRALAERGVGIGSHTITHPHLEQLTDLELHHELGESKARCEQELGRPCSLLAYPFGEQDERVRAAARVAGYRAAFALAAPSRHADLFALPRIDLYRKDTPLRAALKTSVVKRPASWALDLARKRS